MKTHHALLLVAAILALFAFMTVFIDLVVGMGIAAVAVLFYAAAVVVIPDEEVDR